MLEEIYKNHNEKSNNSDMKDLKFKLMFEDKHIKKMHKDVRKSI